MDASWQQALLPLTRQSFQLHGDDLWWGVLLHRSRSTPADNSPLVKGALCWCNGWQDELYLNRRWAKEAGTSHRVRLAVGALQAGCVKERAVRARWRLLGPLELP